MTVGEFMTIVALALGQVEGDHMTEEDHEKVQEYIHREMERRAEHEDQ